MNISLEFPLFQSLFVCTVLHCHNSAFCSGSSEPIFYLAYEFYFRNPLFPSLFVLYPQNWNDSLGHLISELH
jgi:hypothetical protein